MAVPEVAQQLQSWMTKLLSLLTAVSDTILPHLSKQDQNLGAEDVDEDFHEGSDEDGDDCDDNGDQEGHADDVNGTDKNVACHKNAKATAEHDDIRAAGVHIAGRATFNANDECSSVNGLEAGDARQCSSEHDPGLTGHDSDLTSKQQLNQSNPLGPNPQLVTTAFWTSIKEQALVIGTLARHIALPGGTADEATAHTSDELQPGQQAASLELLSDSQLASLGQLVIQQLLCMKHNGAVEKSSAGLLALSSRLLQCSRPVLSNLPGQWLQACIDRTLQPGQSR